jgi:hypothetical protein
MIFISGWFLPEPGGKAFLSMIHLRTEIGTLQSWVPPRTINHPVGSKFGRRQVSIDFV